MTIQRNRLERLVEETDAEFVGELLDLYVAEFPKQFEKLKLALEERDIPGVTLHAHTLKGSSRQFGLDELGEAFQELEHLGERPSMEGADRLVACAADMFQEAKTQIARFVDSLLIPRAA